MNVALYARVSTRNGHQDSELQLRDLRAWVQAQGHEVAGEYVDHGVSGSKQSRPKLDELLRHANHGRFDAIAVWKLDRFARSVRHLVNTVAQLQEWNIGFISLRDNLDFTTAAGRLMFHVIAAMAEFERELIRERVKAGMRGERPGYSPKNKKLGRPLVKDSRASRTTLWRRSKRAERTHGQQRQI